MAAQKDIHPHSPPTWNLSDLYQSIEDPNIKKNLSEAASQTQEFNQKWKGSIQASTPEEFGLAIRDYEDLQESLGKIGSYASLIHAMDGENQAYSSFFQNTREALNDIYRNLLFFELEINQMDDATLESKMSDPVASHYKPWLRDLRVMRPHELSEELETLFHDKSVTSSASWVRLFDETMAAMRYDYRGQKITNAEIMKHMQSHDPKVREDSAHAFASELSDKKKLFSMITNVLAKDKQTSDSWRKFDKPISSRNLANLIEDDVVDNLLASVKKHYPAISHRYYELKAKKLGLEKLPYWDRNAPWPGQEETIYSWDEGKSIVLEAYRAFSPEIAEIGQTFFDKGWIDAALRPGKNPGAFMHPVVPSVHPYILLNYHGTPRDVMTLAHELGHGIHQMLANKQGYFMSSTPLTLAETASVFGEQLTFQSLLKNETDPQKKGALIANKIDDMVNTVIRQTAFCDFEIRVHDARKKGELAPQELDAIWMDVSRESLGPVFDLNEEYHHFWSYIPHFIHSPFYVYAYAFGDCLVNTLYKSYQDQPEGFQEKYINLLEAGGTLRHFDLLAPLGLDTRDPEFWDLGLGVITSYIDQLETLA